MNTISVITINYNNVSGLEKTFLNVFSQTQKNFEYIVIDGGSIDGSYDLILHHSGKINYFVSENDNGIYHAMNKGIKAANGDFVIFMNSGDSFYNEKVLENITKSISHDDEIIYGDVLLRNKTSNWEKIQVHPEKLNFSYFYKQTICQQASVIKKSLFETVFFYNEEFKIVSDWEFFLYAIFIEKVKTRKIDLIISIFDTQGISGNPNFKQIVANEKEQILKKYFPLFIDDYKILMKYSSTRSQQLLQIEKSMFWRKVVSVIFNFILVFFSKEK